MSKKFFNCLIQFTFKVWIFQPKKFEFKIFAKVLYFDHSCRTIWVCVRTVFHWNRFHWINFILYTNSPSQLLFVNWATPGLFLFYFCLVNSVLLSFARCLDSNREFLVLEATALPTAPQPLPYWTNCYVHLHPGIPTWHVPHLI